MANREEKPFRHCKILASSPKKIHGHKPEDVQTNENYIIATNFLRSWDLLGKSCSGDEVVASNI